jgi:hypothetical protein
MTLVEVRRHLLDGLAQFLVVGRPAGAVAHPLGIPAELGGLLADAAADEVAAEPEQPAAEAGGLPSRRDRGTLTGQLST